MDIRGIIFSVLPFLCVSFGLDLPDNTTLWVNDSNMMMCDKNIAELIAGRSGAATQYGPIQFGSSRLKMHSVAVHYAWAYQIFSDRGTSTLVAYKLNSTGSAVYAHIGTTPRVAHVTVDWLSNNLYWTDPGFGWIGMQALKEDIGRMETNGASLKVVVSTLLDEPYGIVVLPYIGRLIWSDHGNPPKLESSDVQGEDRRTLVWQGLVKPAAVSADHATRTVYWVDEAKGTVESCTYDGRGRRILIAKAGSSFSGLQVFEEYLIVSEKEKSQLQVYRKDSGHLAATNVLTSGQHPGDLTILSPALQPRENATCDAMSCDHICIHGDSCLCVSGYVLSADGTTCTESVTSLWKSFIVSTRRKLCAIPVTMLFSFPYLNAGIRDSSITCFVDNATLDIRHLAIDSHNATLYYVTGRAVHRYKIHTGSDETLHVASADISGLAYDWVGGRLLWIQSAPSNALYSYLLSANQTQPEVIFSGLSNPAWLAVDSNRGFVYWIERTAPRPEIWSGPVNASLSKTSVHSSSLQSPQNLIYDPKSDRLYWLDGTHVGSVGKDGSQPRVFPGTASDFAVQFTGLTVFRGYLVWTAGKASSTTLFFRDLNAGASEKPVNYTLPSKVDVVTSLVMYNAAGSTDIWANPCEIDNGGCSQLCFVEDQGHGCRCNFGYHLDQDGVSCISDHLSWDFFLVTDVLTNTMYEVNGSASHGSVSAALERDAGSSPRLVTFNPSTREIIWFDSKAEVIKLSSLTGSGVRVVRSLRGQTDSSTVGALCADPSTNNLFFTESDKTDNSKGWIRVISLDSRAMRTLHASTTGAPRFLDIAPRKGVLVFSTYAGSLYLADMSMERSPEQLISNRPSLSGLALSKDGLTVFWSSDTADGLWEMNLNTRTTTTRLSMSGSQPHSLQMSGSQLYYLTSSGRTIKSLSAEGKETTVVEFAEFGLLYSLHYVESQVPLGQTACSDNNGQCSTLCLQKRGGGRQCQCADGVRILEDMKTCADVERCTETIRNGKLSAGCDRHPRKDCTYICDEGYGQNPNTSSVITCGTSGDWNVPPDWLCLVTCPRALANGQADANCPLVAGQWCTLTCSAGYALSAGSSSRIACGQDRQWAVPPETTCQAIPTNSESLPVYVYAIIGAGVVVLVLVAVGCFLFRRMKKYGGRNSRGQATGMTDLPPAICVTQHGGGGGLVGACGDQEEEVYAELEPELELARYSPLPGKKINETSPPRCGRGVDNPAFGARGRGFLGDDLPLKANGLMPGATAAEDPAPDYLSVLAPSPCGTPRMNSYPNRGPAQQQDPAGWPSSSASASAKSGSNNLDADDDDDDYLTPGYSTSIKTQAALASAAGGSGGGGGGVYPGYVPMGGLLAPTSAAPAVPPYPGPRRESRDLPPPYSEHQRGPAPRSFPGNPLPQQQQQQHHQHQHHRHPGGAASGGASPAPNSAFRQLQAGPRDDVLELGRKMSRSDWTA